MHSFLQVIVKRLVSTIRLQSWGLIGCIHNEIYRKSTTNTPVTKIEESSFPHGGAILNVGGFTKGSVVCDPTTCNDDAHIIGICSSASTDVLALLRKKPP